MDLYEKCAPMIEQAGFVDIYIHETKWPIGTWSDNPVQKEAGRINLQHWYSGLDGYSMHLLTNYGKPKPWSWEEVMAYVAKFRKELSSDQHNLYHLA